MVNTKLKYFLSLKQFLGHEIVRQGPEIGQEAHRLYITGCIVSDTQVNKAQMSVCAHNY